MLGPLEVVGPERSIAITGRSDRIVLTVLVLTPGRTVTVDRLCDALWGEEPPQSAGKVLQNVILRLRRALGAPAIATRSGGYAVDTTTGTTDVGQFERLVAQGRSHSGLREWQPAVSAFMAASALWRGSAFHDLVEWPPARAEAARLEELKRSAAEELAAAQLACGGHHGWIAELEVMVDEEPLRERRWELLAVALYRDGCQADAMRAFQRARAHLAEIGLDAGPTLRELERAISTHDPSLIEIHSDGAVEESVQSRSKWASSVSHELPPELQIRPAHGFAGRSTEMRQLEGVWDAVAGGQRRVVLIGGEAGVGKSRLAIEFIRGCHARGASVFAGRCDSDVVLAYQPWITVVEQAALSMPSTDRADLVSVLSDLSVAVPSLEPLVPSVRRSPLDDPETQRQRLFAALNDLLVTMARRRPVVVFIEDVHWAGAETLALLRHLARGRESCPLVVIVTYRDAIDDIDDPLAALLGELRRADQVERIALRGLDQNAIATIVAETSGRVLDDSSRSLAAFIHARTDGNAFYTCELWRHLVSTGVVDQVDGSPTLLANNRVVPDGVRDVVAARVADLSPDARGVLDVAAVAGARSEMRVLSAVSTADRDMAAALDELVSAGLLVTVDAQWLSFQFAHAIVRDTVESAILPAARARTHLRLGQVIEEIYEPDRRPVLADLARHYLAAAALGDSGKAVYYSRRSLRTLLARSRSTKRSGC